MGDWRFYVLRPNTWEVLDSDAPLHNSLIADTINEPAWMTATLPAGTEYDELAQDGQVKYSRWNTVVIPVEDGVVRPARILVHVNPGRKGEGTILTFTGMMGWMQGVPFTGNINEWERNIFWVIRQIIQHAETKTPSLPMDYTPGASSYTVGDPQPPNKPRKPKRNKGESKNAYKNSNRYQNWEQDLQQWKNQYGDYERYRLNWWEAPYCGEEINELILESNGSAYREKCIWDPNNPTVAPVFYLELDDTMGTVRTDIKLENGVNMSAPLEADDGGQRYVKQVIGLGAGKGRDMRYRQSAKIESDELYQGVYMQWKVMRNKKRLRQRTDRVLARLSDTTSSIDEVTVWDTPGAASIASLLPGDTIPIEDPYAQPSITTSRRIVEIVRSPVGSTASIRLETS